MDEKSKEKIRNYYWRISIAFKPNKTISIQDCIGALQKENKEKVIEDLGRAAKVMRSSKEKVLPYKHRVWSDLFIKKRLKEPIV